MAYDYDELYGSTPWALGEPTPFIVDHFTQMTGSNLTILDVGCGQGRDAIFLAKLGHKVTGIDLSANGISDLEELAKESGLSIAGEVVDLCNYTPDGQFDVVLIDRTLHMLAENDRLAALSRLLGGVAKNGQVFIADERSNISGFMGVLEASDVTWQIVYNKDGYLIADKA